MEKDGRLLLPNPPKKQYTLTISNSFGIKKGMKIRTTRNGEVEYGVVLKRRKNKLWIEEYFK